MHGSPHKLYMHFWKVHCYFLLLLVVWFSNEVKHSYDRCLAWRRPIQIVWFEKSGTSLIAFAGPSWGSADCPFDQAVHHIHGVTQHRLPWWDLRWFFWIWHDPDYSDPSSKAVWLPEIPCNDGKELLDESIQHWDVEIMASGHIQKKISMGLSHFYDIVLALDDKVCFVFSGLRRKVLTVYI